MLKIKYKCRYCYYKTLDLDDLINHIKEAHSIENPLDAEPYVKVISPEIEAVLTLYLTKETLIPTKVKLSSYNPASKVFAVYLVMSNELTLEQIKRLNEVRKHFYGMDKVSFSEDQNYVKYPSGEVDVIYKALIKKGEVNKILTTMLNE